MSLDERLRSGLRTMAEPVQDSERALYAFREKAYPRRARRRVLESVGAVIAAAAIVAGGTVVVRNLSNKSTGYVSRPPGMPLCVNDNLQIATGYGGGPTMEIEAAFTAVHKECWMDETIQLTISKGGNVPLLQAQVLGNGSTIHLRGVVPVARAGHPAAGADVLGARWGWRNWCGADMNPFFEFRPLSQGFTYSYRTDSAPSYATCTDRTKRSELVSLGQVSEMIDAQPFTG